jgi:hypothetical protein
MPKEKIQWYQRIEGVWFGALLFMAGLLWLLKDLNLIHNDYFWQIALMIIGALLVIKELAKPKK